MDYYRSYGIYRSLEPRDYLPRAAWKLDAGMEIQEDELLLDLKTISVNEVGFNQLYEEYGGNKTKIAEQILAIVRRRGKFHNPVTGTGGALYGVVEQMGPAYPNPGGVAVGDAVMSYSSITLVPLRLDKVLDIDFQTGQVQVQGKAVLYARYPIVRQPQGIPLRLILSVIDHAGTTTETLRIAKPGTNVLVLGASGKIGLICAFAARDAIGKAGTLTGLVRTEKARAQLLAQGLFDDVLVMDATDTASIRGLNEKYLDHFDCVVNCINYANTEFLSVALCKGGGAIFFATLGGNPLLATLTAEGVGKKIEMTPYFGMVQSEVESFWALMHRTPAMQKTLMEKFARRDADGPAAPAEKAEGPERPVPDEVQFSGGREYVFHSEVMKKVLHRARRVAAYDSNVILYGATGTGKEVVARLIHEHSPRSIFPYVKINCAAIPDNLIESELFGYEKGAFTGAAPRGKVGYWEMANNGTLFLDEVADIHPTTQAKLLRAIQENEIYRVGSARPLKTNVRVVAATNKNLKELVKLGRFREDLYYRLNVYPIYLPTLAERRDDIIPLISLFMGKYGMGRSLSRDAAAYLKDREWTGNVRELQNFIQRVLIEFDGDVITLADVEQTLSEGEYAAGKAGQEKPPAGELWQVDPAGVGSFDAVVAGLEEEILRTSRQKYGSTRKMAAALGLTQNKVVRLLKKYGIEE